MEQQTFHGYNIAVGSDGAALFNRLDRMYQLEAQKDKVVDFLPIIRCGSKEDIEVLEKWMEFFKGKGVPYVVVDKKGLLRLYKENYTEEELWPERVVG